MFAHRCCKKRLLLETRTSPGYEYILPAQAVLGQEVPQGSAQVSFIPVHSCTIEGAVTCSQGSIHSPIHFFSALQLVSPQPQEGHMNPSVEDNRGDGGGRHLDRKALLFTFYPIRKNWFAQLCQRRRERSEFSYSSTALYPILRLMQASLSKYLEKHVIRLSSDTDFYQWLPVSFSLRTLQAHLKWCCS